MKSLLEFYNAFLPINEGKFKPKSHKDFWIDQIAADLGEKITKYKGSGSFGSTYETRSGKILKITGDPVEIKLAYKLSKNRDWFQYIINYYNVGKTNRKFEHEDGILRRAYYILMDKVTPIEPIEDRTITPEGRAIDLVYQQLIQYKEDYYENIIDYNNVQLTIDNECNEEDAKIAKRIYPHILNIVKELKKHGIRATDFHSGNIGWANRKSKMVLFDLGGYVDNSTGVNIKGKLKKIKLRNPKKKEIKAFNEHLIKFNDFKN